MIATSVVNTPGWWIARLVPKLSAQASHCSTLNEYYEGTNGIPIASSKATRESYRRLMAMARLNMAELVVEAVRERMQPVGFRTGASTDELGDTEAWRIWQANSLDADSAIVHRAMLSMGDSFAIVGPVDVDLGAPLITPEDPRQVIIEPDPIRPRRARAAIKVWRDDVADRDRVYLYLPGFVVKASREAKSEEFTLPESFDGGAWDWDVNQPERLPAQLVPVVRFANQMGYGRSRGEYERHISVLNRINYTILSRLEIATLQAFRQRALKGVPSKDADGNEINYDDIFSNDPGAMWLLPAAAEMWESQQVDLGPIRQAIRDDVQDLAAVTRTPLFYLDPAASQGSAEGASLSREGLIFKTTDRIATTSESWEQVMATAFAFAGDTERANRAAAEVIWAPPERYSLNERAQAAQLAMIGGVPWRTVMRDIWQFSPQQVDRMEAERAADSLMSPITAPTQQPVAVDAAPV